MKSTRRQRAVGSKAARKLAAFAFYERALKNTPYKWLDLRALCGHLLDPSNQIQAVKYYTARVSGDLDPDQPRRQQIYFNALETLPEILIYYGKFLPKKIRRPLVTPVAGLPKFVEVHTIEEKGSDVNLASHLVRDGFRDFFGCGRSAIQGHRFDRAHADRQIRVKQAGRDDLPGQGRPSRIARCCLFRTAHQTQPPLCQPVS